jgi:hypothetical protein
MQLEGNRLKLVSVECRIIVMLLRRSVPVVEPWNGLRLRPVCVQKRKVNMFEQGLRHHNSPINEITGVLVFYIK